MEYIDTSTAAEMLGVSIFRIHQFIKEPCPDCGRIEYESFDDAMEIRYNFSENGCRYCSYTGYRLPTYGRFEGTKKHRLKEDDVMRLKDTRKPGYPKGRKRRKKIRR